MLKDNLFPKSDDEDLEAKMNEPKVQILKRKDDFSLSNEVNKLDETFAWLQNLIGSGLLPDSIKTPQQAYAIHLQGTALGFHPMSAFKRLCVINGLVTLDGQGYIALAMKNNIPFTVVKDFEKCDYEDNNLNDHAKIGNIKPNKITEIHFKRKLIDITNEVNVVEYKSSFTLEEIMGISISKDKKLIDKDTWQNYPRDLLFYRTFTRGFRKIASDVCDLYLPEEAESIKYVEIKNTADGPFKIN